MICLIVGSIFLLLFYSKRMHCILESQPVTLSGMSYIRWQIAKSMERRLYFSLELRTIQESAVLLYAAGNTDYFILEVCIISASWL